MQKLMRRSFVFWINFWLLRRGKRIYLFKEIYNLYTRNVLAIRRKAFRVWVNAALGQIRNRTMVTAHVFTKDLLKTFTSWRLIAMNSLQIDGPFESIDSAEQCCSSRASLTLIENRVTRLEHLIGDILACINQLAVRHQLEVHDLLDSSLPITQQNLPHANCIPSPHARLDFSTSSAFSSEDIHRTNPNHQASIILEDGPNRLPSPGGATPDVDLLLRRGLALHKRSQAIRSRTAPPSPSTPPPSARSPLADAAAGPRSPLTPAGASAPPPPPAPPPCWTPPAGRGSIPPDDDSDRLVEISEISSDSSSAPDSRPAPPQALPPAPPPPAAAERRARSRRPGRRDPVAPHAATRGGGGGGVERWADGATDEDGGGGRGRDGGNSPAGASVDAADVLPDGWRRRASRKWGRAFYYHPETGRSQWHHPGRAPDPDRGPR
jgi:hypothetical protein